MEIVERIEQLTKTFADFRSENDRRLQEIREQGKADPLLNEKVDKINSEITKVQDALRAEQKRADELEKQVNRNGLGAGNGASDTEIAAARKYSSIMQRVPEVRASADVQAYREYRQRQDEFLRYGSHADHKGNFQNAMTAGIDADGGYWVMPDLSGNTAKLVYETSPMRQICSVTTISTDALEGFNDLDEGTLGGWVTEKQTRSTSNTPTIGKWRIPVHEHYAQPEVSQTLLDDSMVDVEAFLAGKLADKFARVENDAFINGNGSNKPRGFLTYTAGVPSASTWNVIEQKPTGVSGNFGSPNPGDELIDTVYLLKAAYRGNARWLMNRATVGAVRKLKDGQGNYMWQPDFTGLQQDRLLGFPITEAEDMPDIGSSSLSIAFGDFAAAYQIVDRFGVRVLRDPYTNKPMVRYYSTKRVGGDVVNFEALKIVKFATS